MLGAISFDTLAFIALVIIASFFRWISKEAEKSKRKSEQDVRAPAKPVRLQPGDESEEERVRRFLEALGQPTSSKPPTRIERQPSAPDEKRIVTPRSRKIFSPLPPLTTVPPPLPVDIGTPTPVSTAAEPAVSRTGVSMIPANEALRSPIAFPQTSPQGAVHSEVVALLSSPRGLRDAVILREIFGPPRSLQAIEF